MKKVVTVLFFLFVVITLVKGQNTQRKQYVLKWKDDHLVETSKGKHFSIPIVEGRSVDSAMLPYFSESWKVTENVSVKNYKITNVVYEDVPETLFRDSKKLPFQIQSQFSIVNRRGENYAMLYLTPVIKEGRRVKRLVSFFLEYELEASDQILRRSKKGISSSVLANGSWCKFAVDTTGVFKIDKGFLEQIGMNTSNLNPKNIRIYGNGGAMLPFRNGDFRYDDLQENAIYISGESDESFDANDYILFYAKGPHSWDVNTQNNSVKHKNNIFSDKSYYFITADQGLGKRITNSNEINTAATNQITSFNDYTFYERDEVNLFAVGQQWFGEAFQIDNLQTFNIKFDQIDSSRELTVKVRGVAISSTSSNMSVRVNGQDLGTLNFVKVSHGSLTLASAKELTEQISLSGNNVSVEITFNNNGNPSAKAYLDYIEVNGKRLLRADGEQFSFRSFEAANNTDIVGYQIQNSEYIDAVWDVTDFLTPKKIINQGTGSTFTFNANGGTLREYIVLNDSDYYKPEALENNKVENQDLHSLQDIDYLVITRSELFEQAERLASYHRKNSNLTTKVVDLNHIYNEFGSGSSDITAIRDFIKYLYDNASSSEKKIKYVCLFGDASYDYKDRISGNNNIVPVFEAYESFNLATSYVTDDYYGMMDLNEGLLSVFDSQDVVTGRIPVTTVQEATQVVDKILHYYSQESFGDWRNRITLLSDDIDANGEEILQQGMESIADSIQKNKPIFNIKKLYADAFKQENSSGGERYPEVNTALSNAIESGSLVVDYFGHGGENGFASERILEVSDVLGWKNINTLPLFITVTCDFSRFDNPLRLTAGEYTFWNANGGAVNLITTTREVFIGVGSSLNEKLIEVLLGFNNEYLSIAESLMHVKNSFPNPQKYFIFSLGDPAMHLAIPKADVKITKMNGIDISQRKDTLKALSHVSFEGVVTDISGNTLNDFNGKIATTIFDKPVDKTTLDNDNFGVKMQFDALESKIFNGNATVENGRFAFDFVVPKDIRIAYGKGKLSFYAYNNTQDKSGYNFEVMVGGIDENAPKDDTGPQIRLFMNDESFIDGGNTNESPNLIVKLADESGINTSITAVDHDIVAVLDGNQANPMVLNEYYETELNNYKKGIVKFPLRNLSVGTHVLTVKAWDTYNNSSEASLNFVVVDDADLKLDNVLNYPNPFVNYTEFWFNHNKPNEPLEVQIQIYTVSGKLVKTINTTAQSVGTLVRSITWNGVDDFGNKIGKGVYVYKLKVRSSLTDAKAEKYEKLVILQ